MVTDAQKKSMVSYLNAYCFDKIWSATSSEYRNNFSLTPVNARLQVSSFVFDNSVVGLPTTAPCMVYRFDTTLLGGSYSTKTTQWYSLVDIATQNGVMFSIYNTLGLRMPSASAWVFVPHNSTLGFIALEKTAFTTCLGGDLTQTVYATCFKNTRALSEPWSVTSLRLTKSTDADTAIAAAQVRPESSWVCVNGYSYPLMADIPSRNAGDYVDVIIDPTIYAMYVSPVDDTNNGYLSTLYSGHREILHCPKSQNPNQWLLTHDAATLFVRNVDTGKSVYLHRADPNSVQQITHNDFSLSRETLDAFIAGLGASVVEVVVMVRQHEVERILFSESAWIADLYLCDDPTIIGHLAGRLDDTLTFWSAASLEQAGYTQMMFNIDTTDAPSVLDTYVSALGYYSVGAILSSSHYSGTYHQTDIAIIKPYAQLNQTITPLVFIEGKKIHQSRIGLSQYDTYRTGISITNAASLPDNSKLNVQILDAGSAVPTVFTPTTTEYQIAVASNDVLVYIPTNETVVSGFNRTASVGYRYIPPGINTYQYVQNTDGSYMIQFSQPLFNQQVVLPASRYCWYDTVDLFPYVSLGSAVVIPLTVQDSGGTIYPLFTLGAVNVFLNGSYLVKDVDYTITPLYSSDTGAVMLTDLILCNSSFIDLSGTSNVLEIFISSDQVPSRDVGYCVNDNLVRTNLVSYWYPQVSSAYVEGSYTDGLIDHAVYLSSPTTIPNGSLFELRPLYPKLIANLLSGYTSVHDDQVIRAINTYLGRTAPDAPAIVTLTTEHKIFSPYLTAIAYDMTTNGFRLVDDPSDSGFLTQFSKYAYLKDRDPTLSASTTYTDRHYLSVSASYTQYASLSAAQTKLFQRLVKQVLVTSPLTLGETLV